MTDVACSLVVLGIMQMFNDKEMALEYLATVAIRMGDIIDREFDSFKHETWVQ